MFWGMKKTWRWPDSADQDEQLSSWLDGRGGNILLGSVAVFVIVAVWMLVGGR